ncbi:MAG: hypothetical protein VW865_12420, partial [Halieaceae bacterium]
AHTNSESEPNVTKYEQRMAENVAYTDNTRGGASRREANEQRQTTKQGWEEQSQSEPSRQREDVGDTEGIRREGWGEADGRTGQAHQQEQSQSEVWGEPSGSSADVAYAEGVYAQRQQDRQGQGQLGREGRWKSEPPVGRVANGIPNRVDRLKGLGNAIVPQIAMQIGLAIKGVNDAI